MIQKMIHNITGCSACAIALCCYMNRMPYYYLCPFCRRLSVFTREGVLFIKCAIRCRKSFCISWIHKSIGVLVNGQNDSSVCTMVDDPCPWNMQQFGIYNKFAVRLCCDCFNVLKNKSLRARKEIMEKIINELR